MPPRRSSLSVLLIAGALVAASCSSGNGALVDDSAPQANPTADVGTGNASAGAPGESHPAVDGDSAYLFAQDQLHTFELTVPEASLAEIDADPTAEEYVGATLSFEGQEFGDVGLRYKGAVGSFAGCTDGDNLLEPSGAKTCRKLSMKVKINWDGTENTFFGVKKLQLHSQNLDASAFHERLGYWLFREMGVPAPRSTHARVVINGEYVGLFALTEQVDGRFTRENFDDGKGNLYKEVWPFRSSGPVQTEDALLAGLQTNEADDPNAAQLVNFATELADAVSGTERAVLDTLADTDALVAYAVVDRAIRHDDGPFHWYCSTDGCGNQNYYWYEDPTAETVHLIPWDLDGAFINLLAEDDFTAVADGWNETTADCAIFPYGPLERLQRSAVCDPFFAALGTLDADYEAARADFLAGAFSVEQVEAKLAEWSAQIEPAIAESAEMFGDRSVEGWKAAVDALRDSLDLSRQS